MIDRCRQTTGVSGLMIRSFVRMSAVTLGFESGGLLTMEVRPLDRQPRGAQAHNRALQQPLQATPEISPDDSRRINGVWHARTHVASYVIEKKR